MIKEVEYEDEGNWYKGQIEVSSRFEHGAKVYTIKSFVEDKPYGLPWDNVVEENLDQIISVTEKGIKKELKRRADMNNTTVEDKLKRKGFSSY